MAKNKTYHGALLKLYNGREHLCLLIPTFSDLLLHEVPDPVIILQKSHQTLKLFGFSASDWLDAPVVCIVICGLR